MTRSVKRARKILVAGIGVAAASGVVALALLLSVAPRPSHAAGGAVVKGKVTHAGAASTGFYVISKDVDVCGRSPAPIEEVVHGAGNGLANVVVSIPAPAPAPLPATPIAVTQKSCRYAPHVQAATVGSEVTFGNSDSILHNVHTFMDGKTSMFNIGMPVKDMMVKKKLKGPGVISLKCDAGHTWMSAYIVTFDHPWFAVTGADGSFKIDGVPPGTYTATFWHEKLGSKTASVTIPASGEVTASVAF